MKKSFIVGFADTEGTPHRKGSKSSLWNMFVVLRFVVRHSKATSIFHTSNLSLPKNLSEKEDVVIPLETFNSSLRFLKHFYDVNDLYIFFWNAPHDNAVLKHYHDDLEFKPIDLLKWARGFGAVHDPPISSFSLPKLKTRFTIEGQHTPHTALGDTLTMMAILPLISKIEDEGLLLSSILGLQKVITMEGADPQHVETKDGRMYNPCKTATGSGHRSKSGGSGDCKQSGGGSSGGHEDEEHGACIVEGIRNLKLEDGQDGETNRVHHSCATM